VNRTGPSLAVLSDRITATFLERPNKYLGIVELEGKRLEAFIPNPGRMLELMVPGKRVLLRPARTSTRRKTRFDLVAVRYRGRFVLIDSGVPNRFLRYLLAQDLLPELKGWKLLRSEFRWGNSRFDFLLGRGRRRCLLEAKCSTLVTRDSPGQLREARFPDAPTLRGTRHVRELIEAGREGYRTVLLFMVQGVGAELFRANRKTDPLFSETLREAAESGVETYARVIRFAGKKVYLESSLPVEV